VAQRAAREAHNLEDTGSKPVAGMYLSSFASVRSALEQPYHRDGAEEARGAHNPEVVGSNPTPGIRQSLCDVKLALHRCSSEAERC
jgi:hypothetical protein